MFTFEKTMIEYKSKGITSKRSFPSYGATREKKVIGENICVFGGEWEGFWGNLYAMTFMM